MNRRYGCSGEPAPEGVDALAKKIGAQLGAIEEVIDVGTKYNGVLIAKVVECAQHPNADRLHVCKVDDGGKAEGVERDENGHVQVVCGAPNVREGLLVAWLPPGSTVPNTVDKDPFVLEARELRGVVSNGMMASPKELGIGEKHDGILEIDSDVAPGTSFAEAYELAGDKVLDIENKMFTHRPDCFGFLGVARELAGIQGQVFKSPDWYRVDPAFPEVETEPLPLESHNEIPELVPRFTAITLRDVQVGPSPVWLQVELSKVGVHSINNIVDYTNFFMLKTGQPLHAYDYEKIRQQGDGQAKLGPRLACEGEKIKLLNGKELALHEGTMVIASATQPVALGGAMGGAETEVDETTKNIIIECANFNMYATRKTAMTHGIFTDAVTRFGKGQSPLQNLAVLAKIVDEIRQNAGGKIAGPVIDEQSQEVKDMLQNGWVHPPVDVTAEFINARLGLQLSAEKMKTLLENVEFTVEVQNDSLHITAPFWRTDIEIPEDIVEEVGRLYGFDHLPLELPTHSLTPAKKDAMLELKGRIRNILAKAGANEVLTYSFVHGNLLDKVGQNREQAFQLSNALSPDLQYYRLSILPSLLDRVHANIKAGYDEFALYEMGKAHNVELKDEAGLPKEFESLAFVCAAEPKKGQPRRGASYYEAKRYLTHLLSKVGESQALEFKPLTDVEIGNHQAIEQMCQPFEPSRAAALWNGEMVVGVVGEFKPSIIKALKLPDHCAGFETFLSILSVDKGQQYEPLPKFPSVTQDICLKVPAETTFAQLEKLVHEQLMTNKPENSRLNLEPLDIYQREDDKAHKQITFRITLASYEKTLRDHEVAKLLDQVATAAAEILQAERI